MSQFALKSPQFMLLTVPLGSYFTQTSGYVVRFDRRLFSVFYVKHLPRSTVVVVLHTGNALS